MTTYYRIEAYDFNKMETTAGLIAPVMAATALKLGIRPDIPDEKLAELISASNDHDVKMIFGLSAYIMDGVPYPDVYTKDKKNHVCLFTKNEYVNKSTYIEMLNEALKEVFPDFCYVCYKFELPDDVLLYKDDHQVVISKQTYEKYFPSEFTFIEIEDDDYKYTYDEDNEEDVDEAIERIKVMEQFMNEALQLIKKSNITEKELNSLRIYASQLDAYYGSKEWFFDLILDDHEKLPQDLKRGILSEDGLYNLLEECDELFDR